MKCSNCPAEATVHVTYSSTAIEPSESDLCHECSFVLHQEMLGHLLNLHGSIEETPLESTHADGQV